MSAKDTTAAISQLITVDNRQTTLSPRDVFNLVWSVQYATLFFYGRSAWVHDRYAPHGHLVELRDGVKPPAGAWNLILLDNADQQGALGYHDDENGTGIPYSEVFVKTSIDDGVQASAVAFHEVVEMLVDPHVQSPRVVTNPANGHQYILEPGDPCLLGSTKIPLLDGTEITLADLALRNEPTWVYSITPEGQIKAGRAHSARRTRQDAQLVEVELDDGECVVTTPDHRFLLRDGNYREAQALRAGDSLMPLYRRTAPISDKSALDYEQVLQPSEDEWRFTHRLVQRYCPRGWVRHHRDFNRFNNTPENLQLMTWQDHLDFHRLSPEAKARMVERTRQRNFARTKEERLKINAAISAALTGRPLSPERKRQAIEALDTYRHLANTPEQRVKASINGPAVFQRLWKDPEWRAWFGAEMSKQRTGKPQSSAQKAAIASYNASEKGQKQNREQGQRIMAELWETRRSEMSAYNQSDRGREQHRQTMTNLWNERRDEMRRGVIWGNHLRWHVNRDIEKEGCEFCEGAPANHKVRSVRAVGHADVYDLTVDRYHNFALSSGVFVHNCQGNDFDVGAPEGRTTGVNVCDFALPAWWGLKQSGPQAMSFRGSVSKPFELAPGGYISWIPAGANPADQSAWQQTFGAQRETLPNWASRLPRVHGTR